MFLFVIKIKDFQEHLGFRNIKNSLTRGVMFFSERPVSQGEKRETLSYFSQLS